jgi:hypothetical protein
MLPIHIIVALMVTETPAPASADPCKVTAGHRGYTVLLQSGGTFVHCREGETTEEGPLSNERVSLQLPPEGPKSPYHYRLLNPTIGTKPAHGVLLKRTAAVVDEFENALDAFSMSSESVGETLAHLEGTGDEAENTPPPSPPPKKGERAEAPVTGSNPESHDLLEAQVNEAKYLSVATPEFSQTLKEVRRMLHKFEQATVRVDHVCQTSAEHVQAGELRDKFSSICAAKPGATVAAAFKPVEADVRAFVETRDASREAVLDLHLVPTSAAEQNAAAKKATAALRASTTAAKKLVADATEATNAIHKFRADVDYLRAAISVSTATNGERIHLGRFPANGLFSAPDVYQLHVTREASLFADHPAGPAMTGSAATEPEKEVLVDRFQPEPRPLFDLGVSLVYSGGLPDHPALQGRVGQQQLAPDRTSGLVGGVELALNPLSFTNLTIPVTVNLPTIIVPFTLNPLQNYLIGAGIGFEDLGSVDFGVHLGLTRIPNAATPYGYTFDTSPIHINNVTHPGPLAGGYFVGLSLNLVGVVRLIVGQMHPDVRNIGAEAQAPANAAPKGAVAER